MMVNETAEAIELAKSGAWLPLAAAVIGVLVRLSKTDEAVAWFPVYLQPRVRSTAALVLGVASGVIAGFVNGGHWPAALAGGLVAGMLAISTHDVVIEGFRDGREIGAPKPAPMFPGGRP